MKVLVLSQHFWPESFRINNVSRDLASDGCSVTILTGKPNYPDGVIFDGYAAKGTQLEQWGDLRIVRVPLVPRGKGGARRLVVNYLSFLIFATFYGRRLLGNEYFDVVFVYGTSPILQAIVGVMLRRRLRARLVVWVQDLWPDSLEITGFVKNRTLLDAVAAVVRWIYRRSDLLLVQSKAFVEPVSAMAGGTPVLFHPNPGNPEDLPGVGAFAPSPFEFPSGFNIVFAGNLGTVQALDSVLDAATLLGPDCGINWIFVGNGARRDWLLAQATERGLTNVHLPGQVAGNMMQGVFHAADALLISLNGDPALTMTIPSKLQSYLAAGKPILASLDGEAARIVQDAKAGCVCAAQSPQALATAARKLMQMDPSELASLGENGRNYYLNNFEPRRLTRDLVQIFRDLTKRRESE